MNRFGYWRDPLCIAAVASYAAYRWGLSLLAAPPPLRGHFTDVLLIPAALPLVLWIQRHTGLRKHDAAPSWWEVFFHLMVWSLICEWIGPHWLHHGTADPWDVVVYAGGGLLAFLWWQRAHRVRPVESQ